MFLSSIAATLITSVFPLIQPIPPAADPLRMPYQRVNWSADPFHCDAVPHHSPYWQHFAIPKPPACPNGQHRDPFCVGVGVEMWKINEDEIERAYCQCYRDCQAMFPDEPEQDPERSLCILGCTQDAFAAYLELLQLVENWMNSCDCVNIN